MRCGNARGSVTINDPQLCAETLPIERIAGRLETLIRDGKKTELAEALAAIFVAVHKARKRLAELK